MKKMILIIFLFVTGIIQVNAQQTNIVVVIAKQKTSCNTSTDLGYSIQNGTAQSYELAEEAEASVKRNNPKYDWVDSKNNVSWGNHIGNYMVIISAKTSGSDGCTRLTYGVGFGNDYNSALQDAKKFLRAKNLSWSESKHGYSMVKQKQY